MYELSRNWFQLSFLTGPPQHLALGVHVGADASVAVRGAVLAELAVLQEDVGGAVGGGACTKLGQVAVTQWLAAHGARRPQLRQTGSWD